MEAIQVILMLITIVIGHETAHALTGISLGYKPKLIAIGIPIEHTVWGFKLSTIIFRKKIGDIEYVVSFLLFGGGVDFYDFENPPFREMTAIAAAGPIFNILAAIALPILFLGWPATIGVFAEIFDATLLAMGMVANGHIPLLETAKMGTMIIQLAELSSDLSFGWLLNWMLLNISLGLVNLFPFPALDGGQIMMSAFVTILGKKYQGPARKITYAAFLLICAFLIIGIGADIWSLLFI